MSQRFILDIQIRIVYIIHHIPDPPHDADKKPYIQAILTTKPTFVEHTNFVTPDGARWRRSVEKRKLASNEFLLQDTSPSTLMGFDGPITKDHIIQVLNNKDIDYFHPALYISKIVMDINVTEQTISSLRQQLDIQMSRLHDTIR